VQRAADRIHINVRLINTITNEHIWSEQYDREISMSNIFAVQAEISEMIVASLQAVLTPVEKVRISAIPTEDLRAYSLYVSGRDNLYLRRLETLTQARQQFEQAIALDPEYAEAYVALAECSLLLAINHNALTREEGFQAARENLDEAFRLNPELSDAYATEGLLKTSIWAQTRVGTGNLEAAASFEYAISLNPNNAQAYMWFATLRDAEQRFEDSIGLYHRSMQLDPLARVPYSNLPGLYAQQGQNDVALKLWLDAIEIHPEWPTPYQLISIHLFRMGRFDEALAWHIAAQGLSTDPGQGGDISVGIYVQLGAIDTARSVVESMPANSPIAPFIPGLHLILDADYEGANEFFSEAIVQSEQAPMFVYDLAADAAIQAGDLEKAREYVLLRSPILTRDSELQIDRYTVRDVVKLAFIALENGDVATGTKILVATLPVVQALPRLGMAGQGIRDVQILALLGRREDALTALRAAVDAGYRGSIPYDAWLLEFDPFLGSIRYESRFDDILSELESLNNVMRERVLEAEETGNWDEIRALTNAK
jgi:tetratricopeptide (TPR) repeat protein